MGIAGLLPTLKTIQDNTTLERYRGKTLAIDSYAWLHRSVFACSQDIVLGKPTQAYIKYFVKKIQMLEFFQIKPYFVFDGDYLPRKANTESERESRRLEYKKLAITAHAKGNKKLSFGYFQKACDVTPEMAKALIDLFKQMKIDYVVAPYEADSQMVYLEKLGLVDGIISEDSDLLVFGCKTLITKLNDKGSCIEIRKENFSKITSSSIGSLNDDQLRLMATISGCDYTKGIPGIGMVKAVNFVKKYQTYDRLIMGLNFEGKWCIPADFEEEYNKAIIAFKHQIVFNPLTKTATHLNDINAEMEDNKFLQDSDYLISCTGELFANDMKTHILIAKGDLHPHTKEPLISREILVGSSATSMKSQSLIATATATAMSSNIKSFNSSVTDSKLMSVNSTKMDSVLEETVQVNTVQRTWSTPNVSTSFTCKKIAKDYQSIKRNTTGTIDSFFKNQVLYKNKENEVQRSKTVPSPVTNSKSISNSSKRSFTVLSAHEEIVTTRKLSPVSKRKKILMDDQNSQEADTENPETNKVSKFFNSKSDVDLASVTKTLTFNKKESSSVTKISKDIEFHDSETNPIIKHVATSRPTSTSVSSGTMEDDLNSSDFVVTDPDNDDEDNEMDYIRRNSSSSKKERKSSMNNDENQKSEILNKVVQGWRAEFSFKSSAVGSANNYSKLGKTSTERKKLGELSVNTTNRSENKITNTKSTLLFNRSKKISLSSFKFNGGAS
ncbi:deoxyribonuclease activity protein [[Candida] boidinii]|nr:deoxyribonuclease activity protein [[Candida] boidinii]OWB76253.1 deoxyribonuclease activity protein [[Candida] boidinii]